MHPQGQNRASEFRDGLRSRIQEWLKGREGGETARPGRPNAAPQQPGRFAPAPKAAAPERDAEIKALNDRLNELNRKLDALLRQSQPGQPGQPGQPVRPNVEKPGAPKAAPPAEGDLPRGFGRFSPGARFGGDGVRPARPDSATPAAPRVRDGESARPAGRPAPEQPAVTKIQELVKAYQDAAKDATPQERRQLQRKLLSDIRDLESQ